MNTVDVEKIKEVALHFWAQASAAAKDVDPKVAAAVVLVLFTYFVYRTLFATRSKKTLPAVMQKKKSYGEDEYDIVIVGLSIAGCTAAKRFSDQGRKVLVIERELTTPDRIVGELMQPGGMDALKLIGMEECASSIGCTCTGYVAFAEGEEISLPYREGTTGCSFHFGDFVNNIRGFVFKNCSKNVTVVGGTAVDLVKDGNQVTGIRYRPTGATGAGAEPLPTPVKSNGRKASPRKPAAGRSNSPSVNRSKMSKAAQNELDREQTDLNGRASPERVEVIARAPLVVLCDGSGSNFRRKCNINGEQDYTPHSHFVGLIMKGATLKHEGRGHVFLGKKGPILAYRLDSNEVRLLVDYKGPVLAGNKLPAKKVIQTWLKESIAPEMPDYLQKSFLAAIADEDGIRSMPTPFFTQLFPKHRGLVACGDHQNQRHPITGGGMTCAFRDVIELASQVAHIPDFSADLNELQRSIVEYTSIRCRSVGCINILSWALYAVFEGPVAMRRACFHYFFLGGDAVAGPISMLSGLRSSVPFLLYHYYRVMFYGSYLVMTNDPNLPLERSASFLKRCFWFVTFWLSPWRIFTTLHLMTYATRVFIPLIFREFTPSAKYLQSVYQ